MKEKQVKLAEEIKSIIIESPLFESVQSELNENVYKAVIVITSKNGVQVRIKADIPDWKANFSASHPSTGGWYTVRFADGKHGMVNIKTNGTYCPICKMTERYKDTVFYTFDDAVEALYASILEFGIQKIEVKS